MIVISPCSTPTDDVFAGLTNRNQMGGCWCRHVLRSWRNYRYDSVMKRGETGQVRFQAFLCHSSNDKSEVRRLRQRLADDGFNPWIDEKDILPGEDWDREIRKAVKYSHVVIVCLSRNSTTKEGYVQKEIKHALDIADEKPD